MTNDFFPDLPVRETYSINWLELFSGGSTTSEVLIVLYLGLLVVVPIAIFVYLVRLYIATEEVNKTLTEMNTDLKTFLSKLDVG